MNSITKQVLIVAHRGASAYAPENTEAAFHKAVQLKADAIEFDVKLTKDGKMVIIHDQTLERTTNGRGKVAECLFEELLRLDAGSHFSQEFQGERIPLLREVLEKFSDQVKINIEITNYKSLGDGLATKIADLVKSMKIEDRVFFSSFAPKNLRTTSKNLPHVPVALLALPGFPGLISRSKIFLKLSPKIVHPYYKDVNISYINKQHRVGRKVNVWTVNDPNDIKALITSGVDGIITDYPDLARKVLEES